MNEINEDKIEKERQKFRCQLSTDLIRCKARIQNKLLTLPNLSKGLTDEEKRNLLSIRDSINTVLSRIDINYKKLKEIEKD